MIPDGTLVLTNCEIHPTFHGKVTKIVGYSDVRIAYYLELFGEFVPFFPHELIVLSQAQYYLYSYKGKI